MIKYRSQWPYTYPLHACIPYLFLQYQQYFLMTFYHFSHGSEQTFTIIYHNPSKTLLTKFTDILRKCVHRRGDVTNNLLITARDFLGWVSCYAYMYRCSVVNRTTRSCTQKSFSHARKGRREGENRRDIASLLFLLVPMVLCASSPVTRNSRLRMRQTIPCMTETVLLDITGKIRHTSYIWLDFNPVTSVGGLCSSLGFLTKRTKTLFVLFRQQFILQKLLIATLLLN